MASWVVLLASRGGLASSACLSQPQRATPAAPAAAIMAFSTSRATQDLREFFDWSSRDNKEPEARGERRAGRL